MSRNRVNQCHVRAARSDDAETLSDLAFRSKASWGYGQEFMHRCRNELTYTSDMLCANRFLFNVCELDSKIVAFYGLERVSDAVCELEALFVDPGLIREGIGRLLIEHSKLAARSWGATAIVIQADPHAERFYTAVGAEPFGMRKSASIRDRQLPLFKLQLSGASKKE